ncbi:hypothetical protein ACI3PL_20955, partial [Lacticaseibacillus paracasei]
GVQIGEIGEPYKKGVGSGLDKLNSPIKKGIAQGVRLRLCTLIFCLSVNVTFFKRSLLQRNTFCNTFASH